MSSATSAARSIFPFSTSASKARSFAHSSMKAWDTSSSTRRRTGSRGSCGADGAIDTRADRSDGGAGVEAAAAAGVGAGAASAMAGSAPAGPRSHSSTRLRDA